MRQASVQLTGRDLADLARLERAIDKSFPNFVRVGRYLAEINRRRLYLASHTSWEHYCREKWDWGKSYAYQLIDRAACVDGVPVSTIVDSPLPQNEGQSRKLGPRPQDPPLELPGPRFGDLSEPEQIEAMNQSRVLLKSQAAGFDRLGEPQRRFNRGTKHATILLNAWGGVQGLTSFGLLADAVARCRAEAQALGL